MKSILSRLASLSAVLFLQFFAIQVVTSIFAFEARASYMIISYNQPTIDPTIRTHIVISSKGNDLGYGPQLSALTKAGKLSEVYPADQVVLFFPEENDQNIRWIQRAGLAVNRFPALLDTNKLFEELEVYSQIVSLHTYGHAAIIEGVFLDAIGKKDVRWFPHFKSPEKLVGHFTKDAFVTLNGCNLGHSMAPMLSKLWQVPVAGALTGSEFEVLMPDGQFSKLGHEAGWAKTSLGVYRADGKCIRGCIRMRPANVIYNGHYGRYRQGLPFYKFFCAGLAESDCLKGMARSLISSVTAVAVPANSTLEQYSQAAREWLCPVTANPATQRNCDAQLAAISAGTVDLSRAQFYTPFPGANHQCTFEGCYEKTQCLILSKTSECAQREAPPAQATTFVDEYTNYIRGFHLLSRETN